MTGEDDVNWKQISGGLVGAVTGNVAGTAAGGAILGAGLAATGAASLLLVPLGLIALPGLAIVGTILGARAGARNPAGAVVGGLAAMGGIKPPGS